MEIIILTLLIIAVLLLSGVLYALFKQKTSAEAKIAETADLKAAAAVLESEKKNLAEQNAKYEAELKTLKTEKDSLKEELSALKSKEAQTSAEKRNLEQNIARQKDFFNDLQSAAKDNFKQLADEVLKAKVSELKSEGKEIISPLNDNLEKLKEKLVRMESLNENLQKEAAGLSKALQYNNKAQGNFGEMILEEVLIACGLKKGLHFETQSALRDDDGALLKPDVIINLPDERYLVVDSKMSLTDYTRFVNEENPEQKKIHLKNHLASLEGHIKELSDKNYQDLKKLKGRTPDFVLMFVPVEYAYMAALEAKKDLGLFAGGKRVAVVTASSLIPIIKTVESLWRISTTQKEMDEIVKLGIKIHSQACAYYEEMENIKKALKSADSALSEAMTKLDGNQGILRYAKKLEELGVKSKKDLPSATDSGNFLTPALPTEKE